MVQYIKQIAQGLFNPKKADAGNVFSLLKALGEEIERLDPRDFIPEGRYRFVLLRIQARWWVQHSAFTTAQLPEIASFELEAFDVLDLYAGEGSRAATRSFHFVKDSKLRTIVERDYRELSLLLFPSQAWKSTVIMAGSILEAILQDILTSDTTTINKAQMPLLLQKDAV